MSSGRSRFLDATRELRLQEVRRARARIERARPGQRRRFASLASRFAPRVTKASGPAERPYLIEFWRRKCRLLEERLRPVPAFSFLQEKLFQLMQPEITNVAPILENLSRGPFAADRELMAELLLEDAVGETPGLVAPDLSSMTQLHHLNDLSDFCGRTRCRLSSIETIVEWGGGYGCMAKLLRRLLPQATYVIIDNAVVSCAQWLYLSSIFGAGAVHQLLSPAGAIRAGRINLVPLAFLDRLEGLRADLFVSTFALSESSDLAQDFVIGRDWFSARSLLVAADRRLSDPSKLEAALALRKPRIRSGADPAEFYAIL